MTFDAARIPNKLKQAYFENRCAVLVGAGASAGAGLPLWGGLLTNMIQAGVDYHIISEQKAQEYRALAKRPDKYLMIASGLKDDFSSYFDEFIEKTFISPKPAPTDLHRALVALDKLQFVLTTNYDTIIERAYRDKDADVSVCTFRDAGEIQRRLSKRDFFILKAHGDASRLTHGIILTDVDYRNILFRQRGYQSLLSAMFTMFTIVFVGASLADPEITLLLSYIADAFTPSSGPCHFALMEEGNVTEVEKLRWFKDFNIQLIPISNANNYSELTDFFVALHKEIPT